MTTRKPTPDATRRCLDFDEECVDVKSPTKCWLYDIERGYCPLIGGSSIRAERAELEGKE